MTDPLLPFYDRELEFVRQMGLEYAERYPKIAARLRLEPGGSQDPHVERMIQAFALMNARIRHKLDDDFPELAESILNVLYPHYLVPTPSMSIVQFLHDRKQGELTGGYELPRGTTLEAERGGGDTCTYRTAYPVTIWPIELKAASFATRPFPAPVTSQSSRAQSVLKIELSLQSSAATFRAMRPASLRFHLALPQFQHAAALYELLFADSVEVALARSADDPNPVILGPRAIGPVGFGRDEGLLPYGPRSFVGYRLLTEYFAFPRKFLFFDLGEIPPAAWDRFTDRAGIYIYFGPENEELPRLVSPDTIRLGCTPIVNIFPQQADPILLTHRQTEYRVVPDARRDAALEVYSIERVTASSPQDETVEYSPFYSARHAEHSASDGTYWHASRRRRRLEEGGPDGEGTDVFLTLVDLGFEPSLPADWTLHVDTLCVNRGPAGALVGREGRVRFDLPGGRGPVSEIVCLVPPTSTNPPELKRLVLWKVISHLTLNHLSLDHPGDNLSALKEILSLYDVVASADTQDMIDGIIELQTRRSVARVPGPSGGLCRGLDVELLLDEAKFTGSSPHLFACVLSHFFGLYATINSFARLKATTVRKRRKGEQWAWPPRAGERTLL